MSRPYETVFILDSSLEDARVTEKIERLRRIVAGDGGNAAQIVPWGKRKLAYPIGKREQATYVILKFECEPAALAEMERVARLDEEILRHLTVVHPPESAITGGEQGAEVRAAAPVGRRRDEEDDE